MLRAITEEHTKQRMKTTFMRDNTITPHSCTVFFIWAACFLLQRRLLPWCNQNCPVDVPVPLPQTPKAASLRNHFFRKGRQFFLQVSNTEPEQNAGKLIPKSTGNLQILYGHLYTTMEKGRISWVTASTSLGLLSQTFTT